MANVRKIIPQLMVISSHSEDSVRKMGEGYLQYIQDHPDQVVRFGIHAISATRAFPVLGFHSSGPGIVPALSSIIKSPLQKMSRVRIFSGQGAQWPEMGEEAARIMPLGEGGHCSDGRRFCKSSNTLPVGPRR